LKHGLCAAVLVPEEPAMVQARAAAIYHALKPSNDYHAYHVDRAAIATIRIERCERMERRIRDKASMRAEFHWDDDRRYEAEILGGKLARNPSATVEGLRRTPHGCEWLMTRWAMLAHAADINVDQAWTDEQTALAFDLMATPLMFRRGVKPGDSLDLDGTVIDDAGDSAAVARRMIAELKGRREAVAGMDEVERALVEADLNHDSDPEIRRLRRYESMLHSRLRWTVKQIDHEWDGLTLDPAFYPQWGGSPIPTPATEPKTADEKAAENHPPDSFSPPFDLTPDECPPLGEKADIPAILKSRRKKRQAKAEATRKARRKKAEILHA
jgi:hypothetical protein